MTSLDRVKIKRDAKESIKGNVWLAFGVTVVWGLILSAVSFTVIGTFILEGVMGLGLTMFYMEIARKKEGNFNTSFGGFSQFGTALVSSLLMILYYILWSCLFVIPGIIALFNYSMTYYIIADNPGIGGNEAIKKSKQMMKGHKWELFVLLFSFFWWYVLVAITFGLAAIYVEPYIQTAMANFYDMIKSGAEVVDIKDAPAEEKKETVEQIPAEENKD